MMSVLLALLTLVIGAFVCDYLRNRYTPSRPSGRGSVIPLRRARCHGSR